MLKQLAKTQVLNHVKEEDERNKINKKKMQTLEQFSPSFGFSKKSLETWRKENNYTSRIYTKFIYI